MSMSAACGGSPKAPTVAQTSAPPPTPAERDSVHEKIVPHTCAAKTRVKKLFGRDAAPPPSSSAAGGGDSATAAPPPAAAAPPPAGAGGNQAYRAVAPATVLIRTEHGLGTGVVIDPKGYILTNHHVAADGLKKDFISTLSVTFGDMSATGRMSRQEKSYDAVVVKDDPVRDLAILKLKDPPAKLEPVKLAKNAPQIADKVMSIGHAGIGFLWAAKSCSIASIGERQQDTSMLAALDCSRTDPAASVAEAKVQKEHCDEQKKQITEAMASLTQGLALQTDCAITHGDSGGPLVNAAGEIVGLNQSIAADVATVAFHVHLDEIREFTSKYGSEGVALLPDPFCDGGITSSLEDIDLDGVPDTLVTKGSQSLFGGYDRISLLIDLDQDHFSKKRDPNEAFDTEIALLRLREASYIWYDLDSDSRFDLLVVDKDGDGKPETAYHLDADGHAKEADKSEVPSHDFSAKLIKNPALHARLGKIASVIGASKYVSAKTLAEASKSSTLPDPILAGGTEGKVTDTDYNGKSDTAVMRATFSRAVLIDADEDTLGPLKPGDSAESIVKSKKIDAEVSIVVDSNAVYAFYDTDNDSKFDLALMSNNAHEPNWLWATHAWRLSPGGEMTPAKDQVGRKLLRPGLSQFPRVASAFKVLNTDMAADEGLGSLPEPMDAKATYRSRELKGVPENTLVESHNFTSSIMLFDLDHDSKVAPKADLQKVVAERKFDAEVAVLHHSGDSGGSYWIYYDTDNDGRFDLVLYAGAADEGVSQAYRVAKTPGVKAAKAGAAAAGPPAAIEYDASAVPGRLMRYKVFKDKAMGAKWKTIAQKVFFGSIVEP
jgi:S1-C subfamily serine protease